MDDRQRQRIQELVALGISTEQIALQLGLTKMQVAAVKAHLTMKAPNPTEMRSAEISATPGKALSIHRLDGRSVLIGSDQSTKQPIEWFFESDLVGNPHLMVVGESGFGKTYALQCILTDLARQGIPSVVLDLGQSFDLEASNQHFRRLGNPRELMVGHQGIGLNPLEIRSGDLNGPINVAVRVADTFARIYNIGIQQQAMLRDAIIHSYQRKGIKFEITDSWQSPPPTLSSVDRVLGDWSEDPEFPGQSTARTLRSHLSNFFIFNTFRPDGMTFSWSTLLNEKRVVIINLKGLEGKTQKVVSEFLLWDLYSYLVARGPQPVHAFVVLDEAHNLSFDRDTPVDKIVREARKFGLGLIVASQQPSDFGDTVFSNTGSKLLFQLADEKEKLTKRIRAKSADLPPGTLKDILGRLSRGHALFLSANRGRVVQITPFEERIGKV